MKNQLHAAITDHIETMTPIAAPTLDTNTLWANGPLSSVLIRGADTRGQAALVEAVLLRGEEPPALAHPDTDQTFYVIEGRMTFILHGEKIFVPQGGVIFVERGQEHTFQVETSSASVLILLTPGPLK